MRRGRAARAASTVRAAAVMLGLAAGTVVAGCAGRTATTGTSAPAVEVAPYVDVTAGAVPDLAQLPGRGVRVVNLGFVTAAPGACRPGWGGSTHYDDPAVAGRIAALRGAGGEARISFGGETGQELAQACRTPSELAAAYGQVLHALGATQVDLDVEGAALRDRVAVHRRNVAVRLLQESERSAGRQVRLTYTLPVEGAGLAPDAQALLRDARSSGVEVDVVNAMTMDAIEVDPGTTDAGTNAADLAGVATAAAAGTEAFVRGLWPERAAGGSAWGMVAVTPMIGRNDRPSEVFTLQDAGRLAAFARDHRLAWLSFWSLHRDRPCRGAAGARRDGPASPECSGVEQRPGDFTAALAR